MIQKEAQDFLAGISKALLDSATEAMRVYKKDYRDRWGRLLSGEGFKGDFPVSTVAHNALRQAHTSICISFDRVVSGKVSELPKSAWRPMSEFHECKSRAIGMDQDGEISIIRWVSGAQELFDETHLAYLGLDKYKGFFPIPKFDLGGEIDEVPCADQD